MDQGAFAFRPAACALENATLSAEKQQRLATLMLFQPAQILPFEKLIQNGKTLY